jgi:hypothetical protein
VLIWHGITHAELGRMKKEVVMAYFKALSQHLSGGAEKITKYSFMISSTSQI